MDRLNVRNILRRKKHKLQGNNYNCVLCYENTEETTFHIFLLLSIQSRLLETFKYQLEVWPIVSLYDGGRQARFQQQNFHGDFHLGLLADLETKE
jgi:hypothetical protein